MTSILRFVKSRSGAVMVDWVVLTGGAVALALLVGTSVMVSVENAGADTADRINTIGPAEG